MNSRRLSFLAIVLILLISSGCSISFKNINRGNEGSKKVTVVNKNAEAIINALKDAGMPIETYNLYNEETDPNQLLGKPNQYISRASFADSRLPQFSSKYPAGGSVEVFSNKEDAEKRFKYLTRLSHSSPSFSEYDFINDTIILRLQVEMAYSDVKQYEAIFKKLSPKELYEN